MRPLCGTVGSTREKWREAILIDCSRWRKVRELVSSKYKRIEIAFGDIFANGRDMRVLFGIVKHFMSSDRRGENARS